MATLAGSRPRPVWSPNREMRKFTGFATVSLFGLLVVLAYLLPLGYMGSTAFKTLQQFQDSNWHLLPSSPATYNYQGTEYPLYTVTINGETKTMVLVEKGREQSSFLDPANPGAGLVTWQGRWRVLTPVYHLEPTTQNFPISYDQVKFGQLFRNSLLIALAGTLGTLLSSVAVAYGFARFRIPGSNVIFLILIATIILPSQITLIPTYAFFRLIGWGGTWWPLIIPHFFANAYNVFLLRQYFKGIPKDLDEAAMMDGANPARILWSVIIPQSWPAIVAISMFHFFWSWNDFFTPLVYLQGRENLYTIPIGLTQFNNIFNSQPGLAMAAAMMAIAVPVVIFFMAQRVFMQGIVITGVEK